RRVHDLPEPSLRAASGLAAGGPLRPAAGVGQRPTGRSAGTVGRVPSQPTSSPPREHSPRRLMLLVVQPGEATLREPLDAASSHCKSRSKNHWTKVRINTGGPRPHQRERHGGSDALMIV